MKTLIDEAITASMRGGKQVFFLLDGCSGCSSFDYGACRKPCGVQVAAPEALGGCCPFRTNTHRSPFSKAYVRSQNAHTLPFLKMEEKKTAHVFLHETKSSNKNNFIELTDVNKKEKLINNFRIKI